MRLLLDTHAVIWWVDQDHLLSAPAHKSITDSSNDLSVSAATIWEIAIKVGLGQWMEQAIDELEAVVLPITVVYADTQANLPGHHRDPFDRLLLAQAISEQIPIVSNESIFDSYGVDRIW